MVVEQRHSLGAATPSVTPEIEPCDDSDDHERWHEEPMESDLMTPMIMSGGMRNRWNPT